MYKSASDTKHEGWHEARISLRVLNEITSLFVIPVYRCARGNGTRPKERATLLWREITLGANCMAAVAQTRVISRPPPPSALPLPPAAPSPCDAYGG